MKKLFALAVLLFAFSILYTKSFAQSSTSVSIRGTEKIIPSASSSIPEYVSFKKGEAPSFNNFEEWFQTNMELSSDFGLQLIGTENDVLGFTHYRYLQTFKSLPINGTMLIVHVRNNSVESFNGETVSQISSAKNSSITAATALNDAMNFVGAKSYKWQIPEEENFIKKEQQDDAATFFPKVEMMYAKTKTGNYTLAYRFDIYAAQPVSRKYVIVDAQSGEVLSSEDRIHETNGNGSAITAYSGTQTIVTDFTGSTYRLREAPRGVGLGVETYNMQVGTNYASAVDFTDADNTWNNVNAAKDQYATDAHFGAEKTYDYYYNTFGRNSVNNTGLKLLNYVHANLVGMGYSNNVNAFWDGTRMTYGDGSSSYTPLTTVDITGHEITHGVTQFTANLTYSNESGAMNEGFSDIFGTTIEFYATPATADWLIGEDIGAAFRSMSNPNTYGQPDTYHGTNWYSGTSDNGGVHTNSGVLNYWYYLLAQGGSGTNDNGNAFSVTGLGLTKAAAITYRTLSVYLTSGSQFANARTYAIQAATDLYGACSNEVIQTTNAWYAVGVGGLSSGTAPSISVTGVLTTFCSGSSVTLNASASSNYQWYLNAGAIAGATNQTYAATQAGSYTVGTNYCSTLYTSNATALTSTTAAVSVSAPTTQSCNGSSILLSSSASSGYKIQWNKNGVAIGGATSSTYSASTSGNYTATISANTSNASTSNSSGSTSIPDNSCTHAINTINVSGLPTSVSPSGIKITLSITHTYDADLVMWLETPGGDKLGLAYSVGSSGDNFTNTVFSDAGSAQIPATGAPYTGTYKPWTSTFTQCSTAMTATSFAGLGNGIINPNGAWKLHIVDIGAQDVGTLTSWKIDFPAFTTPVPNCGPVTSNTVALNISTATAPTITPNGATTFCQGGSVNLAASAGSAYLWSTGATTSTIAITSSSTNTVTVTDVNGCTGSTSQAVTVNNSPTASIISTGGSTTFCQGGSVALNGNTTSGTWSIGGGTTSSITATTAGDYYTTTSNSCGSVQSNHITVTVNPNPTASVISAGGPITFCVGDNVVLSGNTGGTWSSGGSGSTATVTTSGDYYVTNTNSCGSVQSNHITVTVNPNPTASTITAGGPTTFCFGGNVVLSGNTGGTWSSGGSGATTTVTTSGDYYVTNTNSCGSVQSNHITVTVNPNPTASIISSGGSTTFCQGGNVVLSGNTTSGTWSIGGATTSSITATTAGDYYTTTSNSCGSVQSNHITVTVNPNPTASIISAGGSTTFCQGGSVALNGNTTSGTWSIGGGTASSISATTAGDYYTTTSNSCGSVQSNHITVTVNPNPTASIISAGGSTTFCVGGNVALNGNTTGGTWSIGGATTSSINATTAGDYYTTTSNSCGSVQSNHITVTVNPNPTASIISAGGSTTFCQGGSVALNGNTTSGTWSIGGATTSSISATTAGDYYTTTSNSCGSVESNHIVVTVNPSPVASVITAGGATTYCAGGNVLLNGNSTSGIWSVAGGTSSALNVTNTSGDYFTTTTNSCGSIESNHILVIVNPLPTVDAGTYSSVTTATPAFALSGTPAGGTYSGTGVVGNNFDPSVSGAGTFSINYFYTDVKGCSNSATTSITVTTPCTLSVGNIVGPTNACPYMGTLGGSASYSVSTTNASGFTWTLPTGSTNIVGQGTANISFKYATTFTTGTVQVDVTSSCGAPISKTLSVSKAVPAIPGTITGPASACAYRGTSTQATYFIAPVTDAISYTWTVPANVTLISGQGTTSINVTFGAAFTTSSISVKSISGCGNSANKSLSVSTATPATPGTITGNAKACPGDVLTYSVAAVTYASSYNWTAPTGATITAGQGTNTVSVTFDAGFIATGNLSVTASNGCGTSSVRTKSLSLNTPAQPSTIVGAAGGNCNTTGNYSVTLVSGMTYNWTAPANTSITSGQGSNSVLVNFGASFVSGTLAVNAFNGCGVSTNRTLALTAKPATPGTITASAANPLCTGTTQTFTIAAVAGATGYTWTVPTGSTIQSGQGTTSITALIGSTAGNVTVKASNGCGISAAKGLAITVATCVRLEDGTASADLSVTPNPCNTCFVEGATNETDLVVTDILGRKVGVHFTQSGNGFVFELPNEYAAGLYFIRNIRTGKVVKFEKQ